MRDGMRIMLCAGAMVVAGWSGRLCAAENPEQVKPFTPLSLSLQQQPGSEAPESIYAPPTPPSETSGVNEGAVHFDLGIAYFTDYVYRGIELFEAPGGEDRINLQIASRLSWDLGKLPHPFIAVFVNYSDSDPVSTFQEVRPTLGFDWNLRPLVLSAGNTTYIYPDRSDFETSEVWARLQIDDSYFLRRSEPFLSPYIFGAYDYDLYAGWYFEVGVSHDFIFEDSGLVLTAQASVAYVRGMDLYAAPGHTEVNGFQHYQLGLIADYSLNKLMNFTERYGRWSFQGFLYYTDGIDDSLNASTEVWGGAGVMFRY